MVTKGREVNVLNEKNDFVFDFLDGLVVQMNSSPAKFCLYNCVSRFSGLAPYVQGTIFGTVPATLAQPTVPRKLLARSRP